MLGENEFLVCHDDQQYRYIKAFTNPHRKGNISKWKEQIFWISNKIQPVRMNEV